MTDKEALIELCALIKKHKVELHWSEPSVSLEEIIEVREGREILNRIYEVIER